MKLIFVIEIKIAHFFMSFCRKLTKKDGLLWQCGFFFIFQISFFIFQVSFFIFQVSFFIFQVSFLNLWLFFLINWLNGIIFCQSFFGNRQFFVINGASIIKVSNFDNGFYTQLTIIFINWRTGQFQKKSIFKPDNIRDFFI